MSAVDRDKYMSSEEIRRLRTVSEARHITDLAAGRIGGVMGWMLVDLALSTGLRVSEMAAVEIEDIDFRRAGLQVNRLKRKEYRPETIAISKELLEHLREYIDWTGRNDGPLFVGQRGPLSAQGLQRIWKRAVKDAGLPKELSIHSARHSLAVHLLRKTANLRLVQKQLGHASPVTTANMYADVSFEDMQQAVTGLYEAKNESCSQ